MKYDPDEKEKKEVLELDDEDMEKISGGNDWSLDPRSSVLDNICSPGPGKEGRP